MVFQRHALIISKNTKEQLISRLVDKYGKNFKTPLARDLGVDVSTVRRIFNTDRQITRANFIAINCILEYNQQSDPYSTTKRV